MNVLTTEQRQFYEDQGYIIIEDFLSPEELNPLLSDLERLIEEKAKHLTQDEGGFNLEKKRSLSDSPFKGEAVGRGLLRKIQEIIARENVRLLAVEVSPEVGDYMLTHKLRYLLDLQEKHHFIIEFVSKPGLAHENFIYNVLERKKPSEKELSEKQAEIGPSARSESAKSEQASEDGTAGKRENGRGRPRNQRGRSPSRRRYTRAREKPDEIKPLDKPEEADQIAQNGETNIEPAGEAVVETQKEGDAETPKESRAKSAPRKRYTRRKTSSNRSSNYRGRRRQTEKPASTSSETASPASDQAKPEADGNLADPSPASKEGTGNVSSSVPMSTPTPPSDMSPAKEPPPQSFPDDSSF